MSGVPDTDRTARLWGRVADVYDTAIPFFGVLGQRLVDALGPRPGERVLDVATGRGACLFAAVERVGTDGHLVGVDLSSEMVHATARDLSGRGVSNAAVLSMDAQQLGFAPESFEIVACSQAMNEFPDPSVAAREFRRVIREGGRIGVQRDVAMDPRWGFTTEAYMVFLDRLPAPPKPRRKLDVAATLDEAGFMDVERTETKVAFVFPDEQAWWDWAWTTGSGRRNLEPLPEDARMQYRTVVFDRLQELRTADGFPLELTIERVVARR